MFKHIVGMRLKYYFREKSTIFWLIGFPMILGILFYFALSGILDGDNLETVKVAVVVEADAQPIGGNELLGQLKEIDELDVCSATEAEAKDKLANDEVSGIIFISAEKNDASVITGLGISLDIKDNGINQTILKQITEIISGQMKLASTIMAAGGTYQYDTTEAKTYVRSAFDEENEPDGVVSFFYTILAMACGYGMMTGVKDAEHIQANLSCHGMRQALSPVKKKTMILAAFTASSIAQCFALSIVLLFLRYVLQVNFGDRVLCIVITTMVGAISFVGIGTLLGVIIKKSTDFKTGVVIGGTMVCSFLAGMMSSDVKYTVYRTFPLGNYINPVNLVSDSYAKLYYYTGYKEWALNMALLVIYGAVCFFFASCVLRRQRYDSI